jgi:hypothetical protein
MVADVLGNNPELNFYRAEIAATKGERRTAAARLATYVELQKQYLEAVEALLETRREAQELQRLTGLDFNAVTASTSDKSANP